MLISPDTANFGILEETENNMETKYVGLSLGNSLAVAISWSINKSILWAILHGIFGWCYVIYYAIIR
jgi:hypothetical protein